MDKWNNNYELVKEYYEHHGNLKIPIDFKTTNGYEYDKTGNKIGLWLLMQSKTLLNDSQLEKLRKLGWNFKDSKYSKNNKNGIKLALFSLFSRSIGVGILLSDDNLYDFMKKISTGEVPDSLFIYLYNYLYRKNNLKKIYLKYYDDGKLLLSEYYKNGEFSYSTIQVSKEISDIKKETVKIKKANNEFKVIKTLSFAMDSAIDLVVFNTGEHTFNNDSLDMIINSEIKRDDYLRIALCKNGEYPLLYDVIDVGKTTDTFEGVVYDDIIYRFDKSLYRIKKENLTFYTKNQLRDLKELNGYYLDKERMYNRINNDKIKYDNNELLGNKEVLKFIKKMDIADEGGKGFRGKQM